MGVLYRFRRSSIGSADADAGQASPALGGSHGGPDLRTDRRARERARTAALPSTPEVVAERTGRHEYAHRPGRISPGGTPPEPATTMRDLENGRWWRRRRRQSRVSQPAALEGTAGPTTSAPSSIAPRAIDRTGGPAGDPAHRPRGPRREPGFSGLPWTSNMLRVLTQVRARCSPPMPGLPAAPGRHRSRGPPRSLPGVPGPRNVTAPA